MRLFLTGKSEGSSCYFIAAGKWADFIQCFRSIPEVRPTTNSKSLPDPSGFYVEWFGFKPHEKKTFEVKNAFVSKYSEIYNAFIDEYESRDENVALELPNTLTTTCLAISPLSRDFPTPCVGGIWKIE